MSWVVNTGGATHEAEGLTPILAAQIVEDQVEKHSHPNRPIIPLFFLLTLRVIRESVLPQIPAQVTYLGILAVKVLKLHTPIFN